MRSKLWIVIVFKLCQIAHGLYPTNHRNYQCEHEEDGRPGVDEDPCNLQEPCITNLLVPSADSCGHYWMCGSGTWHLKSCGQGMRFTTTEYACCTDVPTDQCADPCPTGPPRTEPPHERCDSIPDTCDTELEKTPDKNHCDRYFLCIGSQWVSVPCSPGTAFDPVQLECTEDVELANCDYRCLTTGVTASTAALTSSQAAYTTGAVDEPTSTVVAVTEANTPVLTGATRTTRTTTTDSIVSQEKVNSMNIIIGCCSVAAAAIVIGVIVITVKHEPRRYRRKEESSSTGSLGVPVRVQVDSNC